MSTLQCAGRTLAVGLHWGFVANRNAARQQVKSQKHAHYVVATSDDGLLLGSEAKETKRAPGKTRYAGGLLAGQLLRDAILYEEIEPGRVWVCAVRGGVPLPDMDRVTDVADAMQVVADVRSYTQTYAQTPVTLVGSHPEAALTLAGLVEQAEAPMLAVSKMRRAEEGERLKFYGALALICLAAGYGYWMFTGQDEDEYVDEDEVAEASNAGENVDVRARDAQVLLEARNKMLVRPDFGALTATWGNVIGSLPYAVGGYRPAQTECRQNACQMQWNWRAPQVEIGYLEHLPGERVASRTPGEHVRQAQTRIALAAMPTRRLEGIPANQVDDWAVALVTAMQRAGARADVRPPSDAINVTLPGQQKTQLIGHEGRISIVMSGWGRIRDVFTMLAHEQLVPERAVFTVNGANVNLQMEARYVVPRD